MTSIKQHRKRYVLLRILAHVALVALGFLYMYPFVWMVSGAFKTQAEFFGSGLGLLPRRLVWENFAEAWQKAKFGLYFKNTVFVAVTATLMVVLFTSMAGYALAKSSFPGKTAIIVLILVTRFLPKGYTIAPIFDLVRGLGLLNTDGATFGTFVL